MSEQRARHLVIVDTETTGLDPQRHDVVEVAWWNLTTDERGRFVPIHDMNDVLSRADLVALRINGYIDRLADAEQDVAFVELNRLHDQLYDNTLVGANVRQDAAFLSKMFANGGRSILTPWHYRYWEIGPYAAGVLGLDYIPGVFELAERFDVPRPDHTAEADVTATGLVFRRLQAIATGEVS